MRSFSGLCFFAAMACLCAGEAEAAPIAADFFNYAPAGSDVAGKSGGGSFGFSDSWAGDASFDLAAGSLISPVTFPAGVGNRVTADAFGGNRDLARTLSQSVGADNTTVYFSFLMQAEDVVGGGAFSGWFAFVLRAGARNLTVGKDSFHGQYKIEGTFGELGLSTVPVVADQTHLFVLRAEFLSGADLFRLYIDPPTDQAEPNAASATLNSVDLGTVTTVGLTGPGAFGFDELRIGTTWGDVTPVPEPGSLALLLVGGLGLSVHWLRRR